MLFVVGYHASGKTHFANILVEQYGALHIETSSVVRAYKAVDDPHSPMGAWAQRKEAEYGGNFFDDLIVQEVRERYITELEKGVIPQEVVITGNRSLTGVMYAREQLADIDERPASIVAVDVSVEQRYRRYKERDRRPGDADISYDEFEALIKEERDTGLDEIFMYADYTLANNGSREEFSDLSHELAQHHLELVHLRAEGEDITIRGEGNGLRR
jgi:dephospho-CoA kinase